MAAVASRLADAGFVNLAGLTLMGCVVLALIVYTPRRGRRR